jgi:hypothetical protein
MHFIRMFPLFPHLESQEQQRQQFFFLLESLFFIVSLFPVKSALMSLPLLPSPSALLILRSE